MMKRFLLLAVVMLCAPVAQAQTYDGEVGLDLEIPGECGLGIRGDGPLDAPLDVDPFTRRATRRAQYFATGPSIIQIDRVQTTNLPADGLVTVQLDNARANNLNGDEAFLPIRNGEPIDKAVAITVEVDPGTLEGDQTITYSTSITCILQ